MFGNQPKIHLNFYFVVTMNKVAVAPTDSKDDVKRLIYKLYRSHDVMSESRNKINNGFVDLSKYQDVLASKNDVIDVNISNILDINMGWGYNVRNQVHLDPYEGDYHGGSLQWGLGKDCAKGWRLWGVP